MQKSERYFDTLHCHNNQINFQMVFSLDDAFYSQILCVYCTVKLFVEKIYVNQ